MPILEDEERGRKPARARGSAGVVEEPTGSDHNPFDEWSRTTYINVEVRQKSMYEVSRECHFSAAHQLRGYGGKCEDLHGHNWKIRVTARATELDHLGMVVDFKVLKKAMAEIIDRLDHKMLNDVEPFNDKNPTAENISRFIAEETDARISDERVSIHRCEVWESEGSRATYIIKR